MSTSLPQEIMITYYRPERPPSTAQDLKSCAQGDDRYQALKGRNKTVVQNQTVMPQSLAKNYLHINLFYQHWSRKFRSEVLRSSFDISVGVQGIENGKKLTIEVT
jgi:hypothetical protein